MAADIIYFHGCSSSPSSDKVLGLRKHFNVFAPSIPVKFSEAREALLRFTGEHPAAVFVGTSLGGYWAAMMSDLLGVPAVLINPSCEPAKTLIRYNGLENMAAEYPALKPSTGVPRIVLLARDDEVIDHRYAAQLFEGKAKIKLFNTGGHRFNEIHTITESIYELATDSKAIT